MIDAPSEAEAQCAEFVRQGLVYAAATEDMDCLTFGEWGGVGIEVVVGCCE